MATNALKALRLKDPVDANADATLLYWAMRSRVDILLPGV